MKKIMAVIILASFIFCMNGCGVARDGLIQTKNDLIHAISQTDDFYEFNVSDSPNENIVEGLGVEWDPHFFMSYNQDKGCNEEDWALIRERAEKLGIQKIRVWCMPIWYEPEKDVYTFDSAEMYSLYRVLDIAQELGIDVNITLWGCQGWLAMNNGYWIAPPNDLNAYAENVTALVRHLLDVKKYTCVKEFTFHNEPDWEFICDSSVQDSYAYYFDMCRTVHEKLVAESLRDRIDLCLPGIGLTKYDQIERFSAELNDIADSFDVHSYDFGERSSFDEVFWQVQGIRMEYLDPLPNKIKFTVSEFGGNAHIDAYHQADIDAYERGIYYSTIAEAFLSGGISSMLHWCFFDQYYNGSGDEQNSRMMVGMFKYKDDNWEPRPFYHSWGLIMKYAVKGSEVYPFLDQTQKVNGVALKSPEGKWTYLITNISKTKDVVVKIINPHITSTNMNVHEYNKKTVTTSDDLIASSGIAYDENGDVFVRMDRNTFVVLTEQEK